MENISYVYHGHALGIVFYSLVKKLKWLVVFRDENFIDVLRKLFLMSFCELEQLHSWFSLKSNFRQVREREREICKKVKGISD